MTYQNNRYAADKSLNSAQGPLTLYSSLFTKNSTEFKNKCEKAAKMEKKAPFEIPYIRFYDSYIL